MPVTFDGINRLIVATSGTTTIDVKADLYSDWKEWVLSGTNSRFVQAFRTAGGDPLGGGLTAGAFFFIQNQSGSDWRIRPQEASHELKVVGNLYPEDTALPIFVPTTGSHTVTIVQERSSLTQFTSTYEHARETWKDANAMTVGKFIALR